MSGMSSSLVVTEARLKSGSLITCNLSISYGRDVYAVPGRITDNLSTGTNHLISQGALVFESVEKLCQDLEERFGNAELHEPTLDLSSLRVCELTDDENSIYELIDYYATHIDTIYSKSSFDEDTIQELITSLKSKGKINEIFPDYYVRT
jgi:DNA processing protein